MAVFTHVPAVEIERALEDYAIGRLVELKGAPDGVENTTYFLTTTAGPFVLTLFERRVDPKDLPFFLAFMRHLAEKGFPAPRPVADRAGRELREICGRPAAIFTRLDGAARMSPTSDECAAAGAALARLHLAAADFPLRRDNDLGPAGWRRLAQDCAPRADGVAAGLKDLITSETWFIAARWPAALPAGAVHADFFPDNVFFIGSKVSGIIDFYFSCTDFLAYDLAVAANAWGSDCGRFKPARARALIESYHSVRPLAPEERAALPTLLRGAALRFLLTRLFDRLNPVAGAEVKEKDPLEYRDLLIGHRAGGRIP